MCFFLRNLSSPPRYAWLFSSVYAGIVWDPLPSLSPLSSPCRLLQHPLLAINVSDPQSIDTTFFRPSFTPPQLLLAGYHKCSGDVDVVNITDKTHDPPRYSFTSAAVRNDFLSLTSRHVNARGYVEYPWIPYLNKRGRNISVLVMNRGSHFVPTALLISSLRETLTYVTTAHPDVSVIFRNTPPGHLNISIDFEAQKPLQSRQNSSELPFHWGEFHDQNVQVKHLIRSEFPQVLYLDVAHATALRSDRHLDGLHYCVPGPIDQWTLMLHNVIKLVFSVASTLSS